MLAIDLLSDEIPPLKTSDTGTRALQWMDEFKISELPIVNNRQFLGLITESDILDLSDPDEAIGNHKLSMEQAVVHQYEHVYEVISKMATHKLKIIPVLDDDTNYIGVISQQILLDNISKLAAMKDPGGILQLEMNVNDYSLSEISGIVESNGARILSSYVYTHLDSTKMDVTIKINQTDLSAIIQTFERYQYTISASFHKSEMESELRKKFEAFIHYLNM
jgi:predicted transcriptional regulator